VKAKHFLVMLVVSMQLQWTKGEECNASQLKEHAAP